MKHKRMLSVALVAATLAVGVTLQSCGDTPTSEVQQKTLQTISVTKLPTKVDYEVGDVFQPAGMEVTAGYSDGSSEVVTDYSYSKMPLAVTDSTFKISYKGKSTTIQLNVKYVVKITDIYVETKPKTAYVVGEVFDPTGMKISAHYNDNTKKVVTGWTYDKHDALTLDDTIITISFEGKTTALEITVESVNISGIIVKTKPAKLAYIPGEKFDTEGIVISTITNSGETSDLSITDWSYDKKEALTLEDTEITFSYKKADVEEPYTIKLPILVTESRLVSIIKERDPLTSEYYEGDDFNTNGMKIIAKFEDNSQKEIKDYKIVGGTDMTTDTTKVVIEYYGYSVEVAITVSKKVADVMVDSIKTVRIEGEDLNTANATLRDDFINAGRNFIENGEGASGGQNICGYNPGSFFEITINVDVDSEVLILANMSDTDLGYPINEGMKFEMNSAVLAADEPNFTFEGKGDYWNWKLFKIGKVSLPAGKHVFRITSLNRRPNIDYIDFVVTKHGTDVAEKQLEELILDTNPTKLVYEVGEKFDPTGMVIKGKFTDFSTDIITDYTIVNKDKALSLEDDSVKITYKEKEIIIPITVGKAYSVKLNSLGDKKVEAENLNQDNFIKRTDAPGGASYVVDTANASGGKSIQWYDVGSWTEIEFYVAETSKVHIGIVASDASGTTLNSALTVELDNTAIVSYNNPKLSSAPGNPYYNWTETNYDPVVLEKGEYKFKVAFTNDKPNLDYINFHVMEYGETKEEHKLDSMFISKMPAKLDYFVGDTFDPTGMEIKGKYTDSTTEVITDYTISKTEALTVDDTEITISKGELEVKIQISVKASYDLTISDTSSQKIGAEAMNLGNLESDGASFIENNDKSSNNASLGHIVRGKLSVVMDVQVAGNLEIVGAFSKYETLNLSNFIDTVKFDGVELSYDDIQLGRASDGSNDWDNWKNSSMKVGAVAVGTHTFEITLKSGCNIDYFEFNFTK